MSKIIVKGNSLEFNGKKYQCAIGKNGFTTDKQEGDNCSPIGEFPLREVFYRTQQPETILPYSPITAGDGWCDDVNHVDYNKHVKLPHPARHEKLLREDGLYDYVLVIGYNDSPVIKGKGSAIFMHIARPNYEGTEGCIALKKEDLLEVLKAIRADTHIIIHGAQ
jgi:L,D-peptidoglycan transpeptidase YkuD (ErfK/YbiS/YcfS/YnhG family)